MFLWQGVAVFQEVRTGRSVSVPCPRRRCQSRDSVLSARPAERFVGGSRPRPLWRNKSSIHLRFAGAGAGATKIGQMPELIGGLNDWIMYQCWESNSRPISPCLDAQIGSHTSHTSSPVISCVLSSCCPCRWRTLDAFGSCQLQGRKVRFMELCCPQALERETQGNGTLCYESTC
jgi:hypothetical protein